MNKYFLAILIFCIGVYGVVNADSDSFYYLNIKTPTSEIPLGKDFLKSFQPTIAGKVSKLENVVVYSDSDRKKFVSKTKNMTGYIVASKVLNLEVKEDGSIRALVSLKLKRILNNVPSREWCTEIMGSAVAPKSDITEQEAINGAYDSVLVSLPNAIKHCDGKVD